MIYIHGKKVKKRTSDFRGKSKRLKKSKSKLLIFVGIKHMFKVNFKLHPKFI